MKKAMCILSTLSFAKADFINAKNTELEFVSDNENANEIIKCM